MSPGALLRRDDPRLDLALLLLLAACVFLPGLGGHDLWNPDEPRYAEVAREMLVTGDYLVPHFNGRLYTQKPPLLFWAMAASAKLSGGLDETAVRLPSALAAIGAVLVVYALGRRLFDRRAAWLAAIAFGSSNKILWQGRFGQIDMLLTCLVACAVLCWAKGRLERRPALSYLFFALAGLATLAKGPVGLLPPLLSILAFLALTRDRQGLRDLRLGRGLLIWAGVVLLWLGPALLAGGGDYARDILLRQNVTRYVNPWGHIAPPWYYLKTVPVDFLPWTLLMPAAALAVRRDRDPVRRRHLLFVVCWMVVTIVFFSLSPGKRSVYVLSCFPALALATGASLAALSRGERPGRSWLAVPLGVWTLALWGLALALPFAGRWVEVPAFAAPLLRPVAIGLGALAAVSTISCWFALRRRVVPAVGTIGGGLAALSVAFAFVLLPRLDEQVSLRALASRIATELPPGFRLMSYHEMEGGLLFYGSGFARELASGEELDALLASGERFWLVVDPDDRGGLATWPLDLPVVARQGDSRDGVIVFASP